MRRYSRQERDDLLDQIAEDQQRWEEAREDAGHHPEPSLDEAKVPALAEALTPASDPDQGSCYMDDEGIRRRSELTDEATRDADTMEAWVLCDKLADERRQDDLDLHSPEPTDEG